MTNEIERRKVLGKIEIREGEGEGGSGPVLQGYAAVFNVRSELIFDMFHEVVKPVAFDEALARGDDARALINHETGLILGRVSAETLRLSVDETGLRYEIDMPATSYSKDLMESVKRGDIAESSFGFVTEKEEWDQTQDPPVRSLLSVQLIDVSPVVFPAYAETTVSARALEMGKTLSGGGQEADSGGLDKDGGARRLMSLKHEINLLKFRH